nr:FecR domain-containing protein [uncultured Carboxylicivirga sp.]
MDHTQVIKYLSGKATEEEVKEIFEQIESSSEFKSEFIQLKKAYALTTKSSEDSHRVWNQKISPAIHRNKFIKPLMVYGRYAAIVILFFALGMFIQKQLKWGGLDEAVYASNAVIDVPYGQMSNITLPDGTVVQLNSGSHFSYTGNFNQGERTVELTGEAFFDVAKDADHPFTVKTKALDFVVHGTSFNIQAYDDDEKINTTLVEGSLGVVAKKGDEIVRLKPGQKISYNDVSKKYSVKEVDVDLYTSWQDGIIIFRNEKLEDIAKKLERWYNVEIIIKNKNLANELYFGSIMKNKPIDQILEVLKRTSSLHYQIEYRSDRPTLIYWE